jgi:hypothetical protein
MTLECNDLIRRAFSQISGPLSLEESNRRRSMSSISMSEKKIDFQPREDCSGLKNKGMISKSS